jgi:hypothetical protein
MGKATAQKPIEIKSVANKVAMALDADILLINSRIDRFVSDRVLDLVTAMRRRKNIFLILVTSGGDADAAYRIARWFQDWYENFYVFISGYCKSAGTLCVLGANQIIMSDGGEIGPLDVQVYMRDEIGELQSGLVATEALRTLQNKAFEMYEKYFLEIEKKSNWLITFKTASDIALRMTTELLEPLYRQIDPIQVGDMARSMQVATSYGKRLLAKSGNGKSNTLKALCETYPSHGFVIDRQETEGLFKNVRGPLENEEFLQRELGAVGYEEQAKPTGEPLQIAEFLSDEKGDGPNESGEQGLPEGARSADRKAEQGAGAGGNSENSR